MNKNFLILLAVTAILMTNCEQEESIQNENQALLTTTSLSSISPQYANLEFDSLYQIYQEDPFSFLFKVSGGKICYTTNDHNQRLRQKFLDKLTEFSVSEYDFINEAGFPNFTSEIFMRDGALTHYIVPIFDISSLKVVTYFHFIEENDEITQMNAVNTELSISKNVYLFLNYLLEKSFCENKTALKGSFGKERGCSVEIWEITITEWTAYLASNTLGNTEENIIANSYSTLLPLLECEFSPSGGGGGSSGSNNGGTGSYGNNFNYYTKNFELCKEHYAERIDFDNMTAEELNMLKLKVEVCGCSPAINNNSNANTFGFQFLFRNCLVCDNSEQTIVANDFLNNLRLPCLSPNEKTEIMKQVVPPCNNTNHSDLNLKDIMQKLKELKIPYISKVTTNPYNFATMNILVTNTALSKYADTEDLSDEELCVYLQYPCLREHAGGKSVLQMISDLQSQTIMDPCDPDKSTKDIIFDVVENMCNGDYPELTEEIFLQNWDAVDKIIPDPSFENCKNLKCVYDLLNDNSIGSFCDNILKFDNASHIDLNIAVKPLFCKGKLKRINLEKC